MWLPGSWSVSNKHHILLGKSCELHVQAFLDFAGCSQACGHSHISAGQGWVADLDLSLEFEGSLQDAIFCLNHRRLQSTFSAQQEIRVLRPRNHHAHQQQHIVQGGLMGQASGWNKALLLLNLLLSIQPWRPNTSTNPQVRRGPSAALRKSCPGREWREARTPAQNQYSDEGG